MRKVIDGPWIRLSFDVFVKKVRDNQADIAEMLDAVLYAQKLFHERDNIWPDQCDRIVQALHMINEPVHNLLDTTARLPVTIHSLRYPLVRALYEVDQLISELTSLISVFRTSFQTSSDQAIAQRREIQRKFDLLVQGCEDILREVTILLDKAHFQEQFLDNCDS